jgi:hypothetical protein
LQPICEPITWICFPSYWIRANSIAVPEQLRLCWKNCFLGQTWQTEIHQRTNNRIGTPKRKNQKKQPAADFEVWLNRLRLRIEGLFNEIQNVGKNLERLLAKTVFRLCSRIVAKMTSHLLKYILRYLFGIDVLTFSKINV